MVNVFSDFVNDFCNAVESLSLFDTKTFAFDVSLFVILVMS